MSTGTRQVIQLINTLECDDVKLDSRLDKDVDKIELGDWFSVSIFTDLTQVHCCCIVFIYVGLDYY